MKHYLVLGGFALSLIIPAISSAQVSGTSCPTLSTDLTLGATGGSVSQLQTFLNTKGYLGVGATGYFGPMTRSAVTAFQSASGVPSTGYVGPLTRGKISTGCTSTSVTSTQVSALDSNGCAPGAAFSSTTGAACGGTGSNTVPTPIITSINPSQVNIGANSTVTIYGRNFNSTLAIALTGPGADNPATITSIASDGTSMTFIFPATISIPGNYSVQVLNYGVATYSSINLKAVQTAAPTITILSPQAGTSLTSGQPATISWTRVVPANAVYNLLFSKTDGSSSANIGSYTAAEAHCDNAEKCYVSVTTPSNVVSPSVTLSVYEIASGQFGTSGAFAVAPSTSSSVPGCAPGAVYNSVSGQPCNGAGSANLPLTPASATIIGSQSSYSAGQTIHFSMQGIASDGSIGAPERGFNVQAYMQDGNDPSSPSYVTTQVDGVYQSVNGVYNYSTRQWDVTMTAPHDNSIARSIHAIFYCSNSTAGCASNNPAVGPAGQIEQSFPFTITGQTSTQTQALSISPQPTSAAVTTSGTVGQPDTGTFTIPFVVTAGDNDVYIGRQNDYYALAPNAPNEGIIFFTTQTSTVGASNFVNETLSASNSVSGDTATSFKVAANTSRKLTFTLQASAIANGFTGARITGINYSLTSTMGNLYDTADVDGMKTSDISMTTSGAISQPAAPTATITASPSTIASGQSTTVTWRSTDTSNCILSAIANGTASSSNVPTSGSESTGTLTTTTAYLLNCTGPGGSFSSRVTVTIAPAVAPQPTASISANPSTISVGQSSTLTWSSTNTANCILSTLGANVSSANVLLSGSQSTGPLTASTAYWLSCTGPGGTPGSATSKVTVTVNPLP